MKKKKRKRFSENTKNTEEEAKYPYIIFMLLYREEITELNKKIYEQKRCVPKILVYSFRQVFVNSFLEW